MSLGNLVANLGVNRKGWTTGLSGATSDLKRFSSGIAGMLGPIAGIVGGTLAAGASISAAKTQIAAETKLAAVLKATGGAAGLAASEIAQFASERQAITNFGDEATIAGAAILGTFKNIKGDVFKEGLVAMQDMAAVMDGDMKGGAVQLGKALNDPIAGISALSDVGVSFTEQQKTQIRTLQESGDMMGAQRVILEELKGEFGGAAEAMADPMTQMSNAVGDVAELLGFVLLPSLNAVSQAITGSLSPLTDNADAYKALGQSIADVVTVGIVPLVSVAKGAFELLTTGVDFVTFAISNMGDIGELAFLGIFQTAVTTFPQIESVAGTVFAVIKAHFSGLYQFYKSIFHNMTLIMKEFKNVADAIFAAIAAGMKSAFSGNGIKSSLKAASEAFSATLASQENVDSLNPFGEYKKAFEETYNDTISAIDSKGGFGGYIEDQIAAVNSRIAAREQPGKTDLGELKVVVPEDLQEQLTVGMNTAALAGPGGIQRGSQEALEKLRSRDLKAGLSGDQKGVELAQQQLKTQKALEQNSRQQTNLLRRIADGSAVTVGGFT